MFCWYLIKIISFLKIQKDSESRWEGRRGETTYSTVNRKYKFYIVQEMDLSSIKGGKNKTLKKKKKQKTKRGNWETEV